MQIGVIGGDAIRTVPLIHYLEKELDAEDTWHIPSRSRSNTFNKQADLIIVLADFCGHSLYQLAKAYADKIGAKFCTASIQLSRTKKVLVQLMNCTKQAQDALLKEYGFPFVTESEIRKIFTISAGKLLLLKRTGKLPAANPEGAALGSIAALYPLPTTQEAILAAGHGFRYPGLTTQLAATWHPAVIAPGCQEPTPDSAQPRQATPWKEQAPDLLPLPEPTPIVKKETILVLRWTSGKACQQVASLDTLEGVGSIIEADMEASGERASTYYTVVETLKTFVAKAAVQVTETT